MLNPTIARSACITDKKRDKKDQAISALIRDEEQKVKQVKKKRKNREWVPSPATFLEPFGYLLRSAWIIRRAYSKPPSLPTGEYTFLRGERRKETDKRQISISLV